ncbi:unnamed protein product [Closterium sp. NIES-54]
MPLSVILSSDKLFSHAIPCVFLGFPPDAHGWQFYHPTLRRVLSSQDVTFVEVLLLEPASAEPGGAEPEGPEPGDGESEGAESRDVEPEGAEPRGTEPEGAELGGAESESAESRGAEPRGIASAGGLADASPSLPHRREPLSPQHLRESFAQCTRVRSGVAGAGGSAAGGAGAGGAGFVGTGGAHTSGTRAAGAGGVGGAEAGGIGAGGARASCSRGAGVTAGAGGTGAGGVGGAGAGESRAGGTEARDPGAGGSGARDAGAGDPGSGGTGAGGTRAGGASTGGTRARDPHQSQPQLQPDSPLPGPSPYAEKTDSLTERREPVSHPASPVCAVCSGRRVPRPRPPSVPGTHIMAVCPSSIPLRVPLLSPPASSLPHVLDPESDLARAAIPTIPRLLVTIVTDPSFKSTAYLVPESESNRPPFVRGEYALGTDVLEDRQEDFECLATAVPHLMAMLLAPEGDPDAPHIPTPRSYAEAITGHYSSQWDTAMDAEMAYWKSTGTYVDAVPPSGANIVDGMWILRVLLCFGFRYSSPQSTPLPTGHSLSAPPSDESVEPSGPPNCEAEIYARAMVAQELRWLTYLLTDLGERPRSSPVLASRMATTSFLVRVTSPATLAAAQISSAVSASSTPRATALRSCAAVGASPSRRSDRLQQRFQTAAAAEEAAADVAAEAEVAVTEEEVEYVGNDELVMYFKAEGSLPEPSVAKVTKALEVRLGKPSNCSKSRGQT